MVQRVLQRPMKNAELPCLESATIAVIGLGYVGLPLAVEFAQAAQERCLDMRIIGYDIDKFRINTLLNGHDWTNEVDSMLLKALSKLELTSSALDLSDSDVFIITVPTPIDNAKRPYLEPLISATEAVGEAIKRRGQQSSKAKPIVIYESTVFPGATEEVCVPVLEKKSGGTFNLDFFCGYSPERINPGDKKHRLSDIVKITSGSSREASAWVDSLYGLIIRAGTFNASSIKVAEAAKVIENTQRDLNIAFVNELALLFKKLEIDTQEVLEAAGTKWNFLSFRPGLVGGHCIGVDPYYLTHKAEQVGYNPQVVLAGRRINDSMPRLIVEEIILEMCKRKKVVGGSRILVLGITFKEDCPDLRNSLSVEIIKILNTYGVKPKVFDPWIGTDVILDLGDAQFELCTSTKEAAANDVVIAAVAHSAYRSMTIDQWSSLAVDQGFFYDIKYIVPSSLDPIKL